MKTYNELVDVVDNLESEVPSILPKAKLYTDTKFSAGLKRLIVETLPTENIDPNTIYLVLNPSSEQEQNVYDEYIRINNAWELLGNTGSAGVSIYAHKIYISAGTTTKIRAIVYSTISTAFTFDTFKTYLNNKRFTNEAYCLFASGTIGINSFTVYGLYYSNGSLMCYNSNGNTTMASDVYTFSDLPDLI